jgi:hypothetical protein
VIHGRSSAGASCRDDRGPLDSGKDRVGWHQMLAEVGISGTPTVWRTALRATLPLEEAGYLQPVKEILGLP